MVNLLSITGELTGKIDLEILTFSIPLDKNLYKFKGYGNFNYYQYIDNNDLINEYDVDIKKKFFHTCTFFKNIKKSIKIFVNGSFHICGFESKEESLDFLNYIINNIINKNYYIYSSTTNELIKIYNNPNIKINCYKINLNAKNILLDNIITKNKSLCFSKILKQQLNFDSMGLEIYYISDAFKSTAVSLKIRNKITKEKIGYINIFNYRIVFSCKLDHEQYLSKLEEYFSNNENIKPLLVRYFNSRKEILSYLIDNEDNITF